MTERQKFRIRITRDGILFVTGILGIVYETAISKAERPTLLLLFAAMVGLPAFLQYDQRKQGGETHELPAKEGTDGDRAAL